MSSLALGNSTSVAEITNISSHGIWLLAHNKEMFMPYSEFPWFENQPVKAICHIEEVSFGHFYWPDIDVDLTLKSIENPDQFPLKAKNI